MLNIVHWEVSCDDNKTITAIEVKIKAIEEDENVMKHLVTNILLAFSNTTLVDDVGKGVHIHRDEDGNRKDIADLKVKLEKENSITNEDASKFIDAFQNSLDTINKITL